MEMKSERDAQGWLYKVLRRLRQTPGLRVGVLLRTQYGTPYAPPTFEN
jgi:hypothetical protein